jgi:integrase
VTWHVFRHTHATLADQAGMSVAERQRVLGHSAESMTLHYTHADLEQVRGRMEQIGKGRPN